jgi:RHS repeat-associated protein
MGGAGGVGALVMFRRVVAGGSTETYFPTHDGNGNVTGLVAGEGGSAGTVSARYEYGPFGSLLRISGEPVAMDNPFRFSSKYQDDTSDLIYYGFRYYNPSTGRWLSRDPIEERGGRNLYGFGHNSPITGVDPLGNAWYNPWSWFEPEDGGIVLPDGTVYYPPLPLPPRNPPDFQDEIDAQIDALSGRSEQVFQFCHNTANIGYEALELLPPAQAWQFVTGTNLREEKVGLGQRALAGAGPTLKIAAKGTVNLPAWKKVTVAMEHIASGHMAGGSRVSSIKTLFPQHMTEEQVKAAVLAAYRNAKKAASQGNRVLLRGQCEKLEIDMWLNLETKTIEAAYPVY